MPCFKVNIKWGRESYKDIECNTDEDPSLFKAQIFALTGVQPERQKVMAKGKTLGNDNWNNFPISNGLMVLVMGTKEEDIHEAPKEKVKFVEDLNEAELATALQLPPGLANLGNTCYMNATVQCLKSVPELAVALKKFTGGVSDHDRASAITSALRDLYKSMDRGFSFPPVILLSALHAAFPHFAERAQEGGGYMQQDANECWTEMVRMLQQKLPSEGNDRYNSIIDQYLGGRLAVQWKCDEAPDEPDTESTEDFLQLSCFITTEVRYMHSGLVNKLTEKITKHSPSLDRDAQYTKISRVDRLPAYLTVQMVRFFYKEKEGKNAKILKDVKFPMSFDAFDLCTKELQEKLLPMREKFKIADDAVAAEKLKGKDLKSKNSPMKEEKKNAMFAPYSFEDDSGSNNSGFYELQAILTHKGRTSNSGHYVGWIKYKDDVWLMCDDDVVKPVVAEDILKLSGGGDWHIAYVLIYGPRLLEVKENDIKQVIETEKAEAMSVE